MSDTPKLPATQEIEMKLDARAPWVLNKADEIFFQVCDEVKLRRRYTSQLHYYDTTDLRLRKNGVLLRTLDANQPHYGSRIQIKTAGSTNNGTLTRTEFNLAASGNGLRLKDIEGHPATELLAPVGRRRLKHWFTTSTDRTELRAYFNVDGKKVLIECALDNITYQRGDNLHVFRTGCEIELEVKTAYSDPTLTAEEADKALKHVAGLLKDALPHLTAITQSRADAGFGDLAPAQADSRSLQAKNFKT